MYPEHSAVTSLVKVNTLAIRMSLCSLCEFHQPRIFICKILVSISLVEISLVFKLMPNAYTRIPPQRTCHVMMSSLPLALLSTCLSISLPLTLADYVMPCQMDMWNAWMQISKCLCRIVWPGVWGGMPGWKAYRSYYVQTQHCVVSPYTLSW